MRRTLSKSNLSASPSGTSTTTAPSTASVTASMSFMSLNTVSEQPSTAERPLPAGITSLKVEEDMKTQDQPLSPMPSSLIQAANAALMERTPFAIDDAGDEDEDDFDELVGEDDDRVLDEVSPLS